MYQLSYNNALKVQARLLTYYAAQLPLEQAVDLRIRIEDATKEYEGDPDVPVDIVVINRLVPRGGEIERAFNQIKGLTYPSYME